MKFRVDTPGGRLVMTEGTRYEILGLKNHLARFAKGYKFHPRYKLRLWDGKIHMWNDVGHCPIGLWREVYAYCQEQGFPFKVENKEEFPVNRLIDAADFADWAKEFFKHHKTNKGNPFTPYDHQIDSVYHVLRNRYCLMSVATSGGKSLMAFMFMAYSLSRLNPDAKFLMVVPSLSLVTQFYNDVIAYNWGISQENPAPLALDIEKISSEEGPERLQPGRNPNIFIGTYQSLVKYPPEWFKQFYGVIVDEAHMAKAKSLVTIAGHTMPTAFYRFGMSGTFPGKETGEILTIQSVTGPIVTKVKAASLMEKGIITKVQVRVLLINHNDPEFAARVAQIRKADGKAAYDLERIRVQESDARIRLVCKIVNAAKTNTLVLFHKKDYGKVLLERIKEACPGKRVFYIDGDISGKNREAIKAEMEVLNDDEPAVLVASYGTLSTGVSIKQLHNVLFTESFKSEQVVMQSIGRALRLHEDKDIATIFDMVDVFDMESFVGNNAGVLHGQYTKGRKPMYVEEQYPYKETNVNLPPKPQYTE